MQLIYFCFVLAESPPVPEGEATSPVDIINFANLRPQYSLLGNTLTTSSAGDENEDDGEEAEEKNDAEGNTTNPHKWTFCTAG